MLCDGGRHKHSDSSITTPLFLVSWTAACHTYSARACMVVLTDGWLDEGVQQDHL